MTDITALTQIPLSEDLIQAFHKLGVIDVQSAIALLRRLQLDSSQTILNAEQLQRAWACLAPYVQNEFQPSSYKQAIPPLSCLGGIKNVPKKTRSESAKVSLQNLLKQLQETPKSADKTPTKQNDTKIDKDSNHE